APAMQPATPSPSETVQFRHVCPHAGVAPPEIPGCDGTPARPAQAGHARQGTRVRCAAAQTLPCVPQPDPGWRSAPLPHSLDPAPWAPAGTCVGRRHVAGSPTARAIGPCETPWTAAAPSVALTDYCPANAPEGKTPR